MNSETIVDQEKERLVNRGKEVCVVWRRNGVSYRGRGRIVTSGLRQTLVELLHPVGHQGEYPAGDLVLARCVEAAWSPADSESNRVPITPFVHKDFL